MNQLIDQLASNSFPVLIAMVQIASITFIAWLAGRILQRRLQQQHFVWATALVAIALVVPLQSFVPSWHLAVLHDSPLDHMNSLGPTAATPLSPNNDSSMLPVRSRSESALSEQSLFPVQAIGEVASMVPFPKKITNEPEIEKRRRSVLITPTSSSRLLGAVRTWLTTISIVYAFVTVVLLIRFTIGCLRLHLISSEQPTSEKTLELIAVAEREVGVVNRSKIALSHIVSTPMAYGIIQPTILLPIDFESWPLRIQRTVVLHELCHVQRRDAIWDFLAGLLCVAYWFHPAVYFVRKCLQSSREMATDQMVLKLGISPTLYAKDLLQVAIGKRQHRLAIPMSAGSNLKERIEQVLATDPAQISRPHWPVTFRLAVLVGFLSISACSFRLTAEAATRSTSVGSQATIIERMQEGSEQDKDKLSKPNEKTKPEHPGNVFESSSFYELVDLTPARSGSKQSVDNNKRVNISGRLLDELGQPVANAIVALRDGRSLASTGKKINGILAKTNTNEEGEFQFVEQGIHRSITKLNLLAVVESGSIAWKAIYIRDENDHNNLRLELQPATSVRGRLVTTTRQPVQNVKLRVVHIRKQTGDRASTTSFTHRMIAPSTNSDENGDFEFPAMPIGFAVAILSEHPDYANGFLNIRTSIDHPAEFPPIGDRKPVKILDNDVEHVIEKGVLAGGRLVDAESQPIVDASISIMGRLLTTDAEGRFESYFKEQFLINRDEAWVLIGNPVNTSLKIPTKELASRNALIRIGNSATITGIAISSKNKDPIPGVNLSIRGAGGIRTITTGVDGRFEVKVFPSRTAVLKVLPTKGFVPIPTRGSNQSTFETSLADVKEGEVLELPPILLEPMKHRFATVVDSAGQSVANATVELHKQNGNYNFTRVSLSGPAKTEMDGQVTIETDGAIGDNSILVAKWQSDGKTLIGEAMMMEDEEETMIVINEAAVLRGKTTINGQPLGGIELAISSKHTSVPLKKGAFKAMRSISHAIGRTTSDKDGNYSILVPRTNYLKKLPTYHVNVRNGVPNPNAGGIGVRAKFENEEFRLDIDFKRGQASISGQVLDANGKPVQHVSVRIQRGHKIPGQDSFEPARLYFPSNVYTDVNGQFKLLGLPKDLVYRVNTYPGRQIRNADRESYKSLNMISPSDKPVKIRIPLKND